MISFKNCEGIKEYSTHLRIKNYLIFAILFLFTIPNYAQTQVSDPDDLSDLVNAASPGDVFIVKNGTYTDISSTFTSVATADSPIIVKAETVGGVTLTGESKFVFKKAAHIILEGFVFDTEDVGTLVKMEGSNNIRVTRNVFKQVETSSAKWVYIGGYWDDYNFESLSHNNRIDHNIFEGKTMAGNYITIDGTSDEADEVYQVSQYDRIDHNYFKDLQPRVANEKEAVRIGWSEMSMTSAYCTVEFNLFENCDGDPEIISVKTCDNEIRHNTFISNYGTLSLRHGNRTRVEGNYFFGGGKENGTFETSTLYTGGIRIYGTDHVIINNYFEGLTGTRWDAPITLTQGDAIDGESTSYSKHFRAERVIIAYNTIVDNTYGIEIGFDNNGKYSKEISEITIANNLVSGSTNNLVNYVDGNTQGEALTWKNNLMYTEGSASLTSDGSTFSEEEVMLANPYLNYDGKVWRTTADTPLKSSGISTTINEDIDGQTRPGDSNPGADHFSAESIRYAPMTTETVGPYAYEGNEEPVSSLYLGTIEAFNSDGGVQEFTVTSNVEWSISTDADWISITPDSGDATTTIEVTVSENPSLDARSAEITATGGSLTRSIVVTQAGANSPDGSEERNASSVVASDYQESNGPENTIDKDLGTRWSADSADGGQTITYDLGETLMIKLVKIAFHKGDERSTYFDLEVSIDGTTFTKIIEDGVSSGTTEDLENYLFDAEARYVRIIGYGNSSSTWTSISEVEIYASSTLAEEENEFSNQVKVYPLPAIDFLYVESPLKNIKSFVLYSLDGRAIISQEVEKGQGKIRLDLSEIFTGTYILNITDENNLKASKKIVIN